MEPKRKGAARQSNASISNSTDEKSLIKTAIMQLYNKRHISSELTKTLILLLGLEND